MNSNNNIDNTDTEQKDYIYIIQDSGNNCVKCGISHKPDKRLKQLQTGSMNELDLIYTEECGYGGRKRTLQLEKMIHKELRDKGLKQRGEWFCLNESTTIQDIIDTVVWIRIRYEQDDLYFTYGHLNPYYK